MFDQEYRAPENVDETVGMVVELLDEIFVRSIGIHILRPEIIPRQEWGVKPDIFQQKLKKNAQSRHKLLADQYKDLDDQEAAAARREEQQRSLSLRRGPGINDTGKPKRGKSMALEPYSPSISESSNNRPLAKRRTFKNAASSLQPALSPGLRLVLLEKEKSPDLPVY